jgi:hypothetical protein
VEAARIWRRWLADQKYRATKHGKAVRKCQSERYRKRCPKESSSMPQIPEVKGCKAKRRRNSHHRHGAYPIVPPPLEPVAPAPASAEPVAFEPVATRNQAAIAASPPMTRVGDSQPTSEKKSCCHRPGCYEMFIPDPRTPDQKYCSPECAQAMRRVLVREKRYRDQLAND